MSRLISRILLAMLMFPLAAILYMLAVVIGTEVQRHSRSWSPQTETIVFIAAGLVTCAFVAVYWLGLWFTSVRWTVARILATLLAAGGAVLAAIVMGCLLGVAMQRNNAILAVFLGTVIAPLLWLTATVLIFRETPAERRARLDQSKQALLCPTCGYNLTGLTSTRCPECGAMFTLDALLHNQPSRVAGELEA